MFCTIAFLSAWASKNIPQEKIELQFLGPNFMTERLILTIIFIVIMQVPIERLIKWSDSKQISGGEEDASI